MPASPDHPKAAARNNPVRYARFSHYRAYLVVKCRSVADSPVLLATVRGGSRPAHRRAETRPGARAHELLRHLGRHGTDRLPRHQPLPRPVPGTPSRGCSSTTRRHQLPGGRARLLRGRRGRRGRPGRRRRPRPPAGRRPGVGHLGPPQRGRRCRPRSCAATRCPGRPRPARRRPSPGSAPSRSTRCSPPTSTSARPSPCSARASSACSPPGSSGSPAARSWRSTRCPAAWRRPLEYGAAPSRRRPRRHGRGRSCAELTDGRGADVAIEISGSYPALHEAIRSVAVDGRVVASGFYQGDGVGLRLGDEFHHNRVAAGLLADRRGAAGRSPGAGRPDPAQPDLPAAGPSTAGRPASALVTHVVPVDEAAGTRTRCSTSRPARAPSRWC